MKGGVGWGGEASRTLSTQQQGWGSPELRQGQGRQRGEEFDSRNDRTYCLPWKVRDAKLPRCKESTLRTKKMRLPFTETWSNKGAAPASLKAVQGMFRCLGCIRMEMPIIYLGLGLRGQFFNGLIEDMVVDGVRWGTSVVSGRLGSAG